MHSSEQSSLSFRPVSFHPRVLSLFVFQWVSILLSCLQSCLPNLFDQSNFRRPDLTFQILFALTLAFTQDFLGKTSFRFETRYLFQDLSWLLKKIAVCFWASSYLSPYYHYYLEAFFVQNFRALGNHWVSFVSITVWFVNHNYLDFVGISVKSLNLIMCFANRQL